MSKSAWIWLKWGCLGVSCTSLIVAVTLMWSHQGSGVSKGVGEETSQSDAGTNVESPWMVERKGHHVLWRLKANDAKQGLTSMHFNQPYLELFNKNNEKMTVNAQQADVNTLTRDVHFQGHVVVHFQTWTLLSDTLDVEHSTGDILVPQQFTAHNPSSTIKGRGLRIHHETRDMWIQHDVWMQDRDIGGNQGGK
ncbi:MAG: LPS export ABC transporter periplasmic protein LptC [Mariprofundaceae bacterium]|nr:LPS export ABC transporter periplasmic protein LptC [Mariprofundaceae bacterium]